MSDKVDEPVAVAGFGVKLAFTLDGRPLRLKVTELDPPTDVRDAAQPLTPFGARNSALLVSRSTDGAQTWGAPTTLLRNKSSHVLNDKNSITADPTSQGHVYAVWDQLSVFPATGGEAQVDQLLGANDGVVIARELAGLLTAAAGGAPSFKFSFTGPSFLSTTANNGDTWSPARPIFQPGTNAQTIDNIVVVPPSGDVLDFFTAINFTGSPTAPGVISIGHIVSTDKGATWSGPTFASDIQVTGVVTPDSGGPIRDASILYSVAVDPTSGAIYLAWQDFRLTTPATCTTPAGTIPVDGILFSQSTDGGATWSTPVQINKAPANANPCRQQAFIPAIVAAGDGTVVVTYYDFRNDTNTPSGFEATDYFAVFCTPTTPTPAARPPTGETRCG
ncbi:MAG TPA: sialidase family protein [Candidatus Angelobacter sp.]|nr:sialidase family protein [Candidatus Angelobacter sp.]